MSMQHLARLLDSEIASTKKPQQKAIPVLETMLPRSKQLSFIDCYVAQHNFGKLAKGFVVASRQRAIVALPSLVFHDRMASVRVILKLKSTAVVSKFRCILLHRCRCCRAWNYGSYWGATELLVVAVVAFFIFLMSQAAALDFVTQK